MPPELNVSLSVKDVETGKELISAYEKKLTTPDPDAASEIFKEIYKEALNSHRFYGTIREKVAWPPATIIGGALTYFSQNISTAPLPYVRYYPAIMLFILMSLITCLNYHLQKRQAKCIAVAKEAQVRWLKCITSGMEPPKTYAGLSDEVGENYKKIPDMASWAFPVFGLLLVILNIIVALHS